MFAIVKNSTFVQFLPEGTPFNLSSRTDVDFLDPRVGDEISKLIDELNNFEDGEDAKN